MSGAQWSPERLRAMANGVPPMPGYEAHRRDIADALRAFARVVSVLEGLDIVSRANAVAFAYGAGSYVAQLYDTHEGDWSAEHGRGDTPLAAILALADALDARGGA